MVGPRVTMKNPPIVKTPSKLELVNGTLTADQLIYMMVKFLHITRDFSGECENKMWYCVKSKALLYSLFGKGITFEVCVDAAYKSASYTVLRNFKNQATHTVKFSKDQQKLVKLICKYKRQFDGWGDDPQCLRTQNAEIRQLKAR